MKKTKKYIFLFMALIGIPMCFFSLKKIISHEHEMHEKIGSVQNTVQRIEKTLELPQEPQYKMQMYKAYSSLISHVCDKNVSTDVYTSIACGRDINILIVGDSIGALNWPNQLSSWIEYNYNIHCSVTNISMGGNSSYAGFVRSSLLPEEENYDLAVICYGQNDLEENFSQYYESIIRVLLSKNPAISLISVLESSQRDYTSKMQAILELTDYYSIPVVDTIKMYNTSEYSYESLSPDGVHPGELGQSLYLSAFMELISSKIEESYERINSFIEKSLKNEKNPQDVLSFNTHYRDSKYNALPVLSECTFFTRNMFSQTSPESFEMNIDMPEKIVGIYKSRCPGLNTLKLFIDGEEVIYNTEQFDHSFSQPMIFLLSDTPVLLSGKLIIEFNSQEQAESFQGLVFSE